MKSGEGGDAGEDDYGVDLYDSGFCGRVRIREEEEEEEEKEDKEEERIICLEGKTDSD